MATLNKLPTSRVVSVNISLSGKGAQSQSLTNALVLGDSIVIDPVELYRTYADATGVAADFGSTGSEYLAALAWFSQSPSPKALLIGRWYPVAGKGGMRCGTLSSGQQNMLLTSGITNGGFSFTVDGAATPTNVVSINLSSVASMDAVAAVIDTAFTSGTVVWNGVYSRFEITSNTTGQTSSLSVLAAPTSGTSVDLSNLLGGQAASGAYGFSGFPPSTDHSQTTETPAQAFLRYDANLGRLFYGVGTVGTAVPTAAQQVDAGKAVQGSINKHLWFYTSQDPNSLSTTSTTDALSLMKAASVQRAFGQYSSTSAVAVWSAAAKLLTVNYAAQNSTITLKFKTEPGITAENLNVTQANAVEAKNGNVFVQYDNGTAIIEQGVTADGTFVDEVTGTDWLSTALQTAVYNVLYSGPSKVPQTDAGQQRLITASGVVMNQAVFNGLIAPGTWGQQGFGILAEGDFMPTGWYIYSPPFSTQLPADRAARKSMPIQIAAKGSGAINSADVQVNFNF